MLGALHVMCSSPNLIKSSLVSMLNKSRQVSLFTLKAGMCIREKLENIEREREREREREVQTRSEGVQAVREKEKKCNFFFAQDTREKNWGFSLGGDFECYNHRGMKYSKWRSCCYIGFTGSKSFVVRL